MVKQMKKLVHKALRSLGFMMVPDWGIPLIALSRHLQILFQTLKIDCVLDVGANIGQYRDFLRNWVSYKGLIISFEPVPYNVWHLKQRRRQDPVWEIQDYALGSNNILKELGITSDTQFS